MHPSESLPEKYQATYRHALQAVLPKLSGLQSQVIQALFSAPKHTQSAGAIARQLGVHNVNISQALSQIGMAMLEDMDIPLDQAVQLFPRQWRILAITGRSNLVKGFPWQLRPEVVEVLSNYEQTNDQIDADELIAREPLTEGMPGAITETTRRNALARAQCLAAYRPLVCQVCGLDFVQTYGAEFGVCLHVHAHGEVRSLSLVRDLIQKNMMNCP